MSAFERSNDIVKFVREHVDPLELVRLASEIALGKLINGRRPTIHQRLQASIWLLELGWGKPVQPIRVIVKGKRGVPFPLAPMLASIWDN
jgi:hypothetical protein